MVTNRAIWLVIDPVRIFLSLPTGHGNAFVSRRVHPYFCCHFLSRFSSSAVFCRKDVGHYPKPINNLWILSFLSQITLVERQILVSEWICISNSVITLVDKRPKNRLQLILIVHNKYQESWNVRYSVTAELIDGFFMHLISELSQTTWS